MESEGEASEAGAGGAEPTGTLDSAGEGGEGDGERPQPAIASVTKRREKGERRKAPGNGPRRAGHSLSAARPISGAVQ